MDSSCGCVQSQNGESHITITVSFICLMLNCFRHFFKPWQFGKWRCPKPRKNTPSKHPTCIKRVHLYTPVSGMNLYPCHSKTSGVDPPRGHLPDSVETPTAQLLLPHATRDFPGTKAMVVGCQLFWGGYSSPVNWKLGQTQQSTNFERFQKTKDKEEKKAPKNIPNQRIGWNSSGTVTKKKLSRPKYSKWLFRPFKLFLFGEQPAISKGTEIQ